MSARRTASRARPPRKRGGAPRAPRKAATHAASPLDRPAAQAALVVLLCLIWGSTWYAIRVGLRDLPPFFGGGLRYLAATAIIAALALGQGVRAPRGRRVHLALLALGLGAFGLSFGVVYWGEQYISGGLAAVLFATHPLLVALVAAWVIPDETLSLRKLAGVLLGFAGVAVLMSDDVSLAHPRAPMAAAIVLISPLVASVANVSVKRFGGSFHPFNLTALPMFYGGAALLIASALFEDWQRVSWTVSAVAAVAYLAVFGSTIGVVGFYALLKRVPVSRLALISYLFPVVAVLLDVTLAGERFGVRGLLGSGVVLAGVVLAGVRRRDAATPEGGAPVASARV